MNPFHFYFNCCRIYIRIIAFKWVKMLFSILCTLLTLLTITVYVKELNTPKVTITEAVFVIVIIFIGALVATIPSTYKSYNVKGLEGLKIQLVFGDILDTKMDIVIPTNTSFDTDSSCIKRSSIQGQFCNRFYDGRSEFLGSQLSKIISAQQIEGQFLNDKKVGNKIRYPINTIITLKRGRSAESQVFYWIAINDHDNAGDVPHDNIKITKSIDSLWDYLIRHRKVRSIAIPILGTGLAGVNQPTFDVFEYIVDTFILTSMKHKIAETLRIYVYPKDYISFLDFELANRYLKFRCEHPLNIETKTNF